MFYTQRRVWTQPFTYPLYILPLLLYHYPPQLPIILVATTSALLFLLPLWSVRLKILFTLKATNKTESKNLFVLFEDKLQLVQNGCFYSNAQKYLIHDDKFVLVEPFTLTVNEYLSYKESVLPHITPHLDSNEFRIERAGFFAMMKQHAIRPFFVFQIFCGVLWCLDEYVYHALLTIFLLVVFEMGVVFHRVKSTNEFRKLNLVVCDVLKKEINNINNATGGKKINNLKRDMKINNLNSGVDRNKNYNGVDMKTNNLNSITGSKKNENINSTIIDEVNMSNTNTDSDSNISTESGNKAETINRIKKKVGFAGQRKKSIYKVEIEKTSRMKTVEVITKKYSYKKIKSTEIKPGDIIKIEGAGIQIPCDLLILEGSCAVNEAMLSGESVPFTKERIVSSDAILDYKNDKKSILFGGTELIKCTDLLCYALKTGINTTQGQLIRTMMCAEDTVTCNNKESLFFILFLLFFAIVAAVYSAYNSILAGKSAYKIMLEVIIILTNVVPPELPMELTIAVNASLQSLMKIGVFCLEPFRIPFAGKVDVCCFDKTGTLTESNLSIFCIYEIDEKRSNQSEGKKYILTVKRKDKKQVVDSNPNKEPLNKNLPLIRMAVGTCHSLVSIKDKHEGDPVDISAFDHLNLNLIDEDNSSWENEKYKILKRFVFSSALRRMGVVSEYAGKYYSVVKGAPEVIATFLGIVPDGYDKYIEFAKNGYRVISVAIKEMKRITEERCEVEKDLNFLCFLVYECKIKDGAAEVVDVLLRSGHKVVVITGDNLLTAVSVANRLNIKGECVDMSVDKNKNLIDVSGNVDTVVIENNEELISNKRNNELIENNEELISNKRNKFIHLSNDDEFMKVTVFARADPSHKEKIIERYKSMGKITMMCGDGTNDVGALKAAHVGVAIVESESRRINNEIEEIQIKMGDASVAAPFTIKNGRLGRILDIVRQGRSALVTTTQMYKILAMNSLVTAFSLSVLDSLGIRYSDAQMTVQGVLIAFSYMFLTTSRPLNQISLSRPLDSIFNCYIIGSILLQSVIHIATYVVILRYNEVDATSTEFKPGILNTILYIISTFQQIATFTVNYIGRPFRESIYENYPLLITLSASVYFIYLCVDGTSEHVKSLELINITKNSKFGLLVLMCCVLIACFLVERFCFMFFMVGRRRIN